MNIDYVELYIIQVYLELRKIRIGYAQDVDAFNLQEIKPTDLFYCINIHLLTITYIGQNQFFAIFNVFNISKNNIAHCIEIHQVLFFRLKGILSFDKEIVGFER